MKKNFVIRSILSLVLLVGIIFSIYIYRGCVEVMTVLLSMDSSSKVELIENYESKEKQVIELKQFFTEIVPPGYLIYIEIRDKNDIDMWVHVYSDSSEMTCLFQEWNINPCNYIAEPLTHFDSIYGPETNSLKFIKEKLSWDDDTFIQIEKYLENANCISIENGNPFEIGFARSGLGKYSYYLFDEPIPTNEIENWNDSCEYIYYKPKVVLGYAGGAIGPQCFPDQK